MKKTTISLLIFFSLTPFFFVESAEYRMGLSMHDVERRIEGGAALSFEKIFDKPGWWSSYAGRPHLGTHISLANNTHLLYADLLGTYLKKEGLAENLVLVPLFTLVKKKLKIIH